MNEKLLEKKLAVAVKRIGGMSFKWTSPGFTGVPDRMILMQGGGAFFAEIKTTGEKPSPRQQVVHRLLEGLGFRVFIIDSQETLNNCIDAIRSK